MNPSVAPLLSSKGTLGPLGPSGALRGPPKHARNLGPMSFLARIVLLILVCVQIAPRLRATHSSEQIENDVVIERDLADLCSKCYFSGDLNLVSSIDLSKPLPNTEISSYIYSCYSFQNPTEHFGDLELELIWLEFANNSHIFCAMKNRNFQRTSCLLQRFFLSLAFASCTECIWSSKRQTTEQRGV